VAKEIPGAAEYNAFTRALVLFLAGALVIVVILIVKQAQKNGGSDEPTPSPSVSVPQSVRSR